MLSTVLFQYRLTVVENTLENDRSNATVLAASPVSTTFDSTRKRCTSTKRSPETLSLRQSPAFSARYGLTAFEVLEERALAPQAVPRVPMLVVTAATSLRPVSRPQCLLMAVHQTCAVAHRRS